MGNSQSNLLERLDDIASEYILQADFNTLKKLQDKDYCEKVTIVTKDILLKQFSHMDIEYLATRADKGWSVTNMLTKTQQETGENGEKVVKYPSKTNIGYVTNINNPDKPAMCLSVSKFYVKIGHIFSAIVGAIQPQYKTPSGEQYSILTPKDKFASFSIEPVFELTQNGFCFKRIQSLQFGRQDNINRMNPQFCNINKGASTANDLAGVPELEMLYMDDSDEQGNPIMSDKNQRKYRKDLTTFYKRFTGEKDIPDNVTKFSDIQLTQYDGSNHCMDSEYTKPVDPVEERNERENILYVDYALNLNEMIKVTGDLQKRLVNVLNKIFTYAKDNGENEKKITIVPNLTVYKLDNLIVETRNTLLELYIRCEEYFENGVNIYKAIVNDRLLDTNIENIQDQATSATMEYPEEEEPSAQIMPVPIPLMEPPMNSVEEPQEEPYEGEEAEPDVNQGEEYSTPPPLEEEYPESELSEYPLEKQQPIEDTWKTSDMISQKTPQRPDLVTPIYFKSPTPELSPMATPMAPPPELPPMESQMEPPELSPMATPMAPPELPPMESQMASPELSPMESQNINIDNDLEEIGKEENNIYAPTYEEIVTPIVKTPQNITPTYSGENYVQRTTPFTRNYPSTAKPPVPGLNI